MSLKVVKDFPTKCIHTAEGHDNFQASVCIRRRLLKTTVNTRERKITQTRGILASIFYMASENVSFM